MKLNNSFANQILFLTVWKTLLKGAICTIIEHEKPIEKRNSVIK